jgi:restriction endonuclease Mrr
VGLIIVLIVFAAVSAHPWIILVALALGATYAYWRWWQAPRRYRQRTLAVLRAEEDAELAREERAYAALRERSQTLGGLLTLTPREFEIRVGEILREYGYEDVEHVGRTGDLGIDIFATDPNGERVGVQCKRYALDKLARAPEVRLLYGDMTHAGVRGVFVTTSDFTADARAYADSHGINLINGERLTQLLSALPPEGGVPEISV